MNHFDAIAAVLDSYGLDGMLLTGAANRYYATGFLADDEGGVALVTKKGNFFFTDMRYIEAAEAAVDNAAIGLVCREKGYVAWLNEALELSGAKVVGFEEEKLTVADFRLYEEKLNCELRPATALMLQLRQSKGEQEIACMIGAQRIAEKAFRQLLQEIKPGVTERQLAARLQYLAISAGAEKMSFDTIVASGPNGSMPHAVPSDRAVQEGDFITFDFGCVYKGYCSDMTRTVAVGQVSEEMEKVYHIVLEAQQSGLEAARAGKTGREVDAAARDVIAAAGYGEYFGHSLGHSLGLEVHESPNANPGNDQPLPLHAVISVEPGIYLPGRFGVRIEDVVVLEEGGCRNLMEMEKKLLHL
ncbi:MAG: aminopeptidase P family protein [Oscillospiraceae bacterium]|nr:aminopeptidase P family protein [Oscillospiraceae bacterium]